MDTVRRGVFLSESELAAVVSSSSALILGFSFAASG